MNGDDEQIGMAAVGWEMPFQPLREEVNVSLERYIDSYVRAPDFQPLSTTESQFIHVVDEDPDDPDQLSARELLEIEHSQIDYLAGRYKKGFIGDLLEDLRS